MDTNDENSSLVISGIVLGGIAVLVLSVVLAVPVVAHNWQNTTTDGEYELGIDADPDTPVVDSETEFHARIQNTTAAKASTRHAGGIVNETVTVTITDPNSGHDRLTATIPENDAQFGFSYRFSMSGTYEIAVTATIDGEQIAFQTERRVAPATTASKDTPSTETYTNSGSLRRKLTTIQLLSGMSVVFALGAFGAAVLAYRGTD